MTHETDGDPCPTPGKARYSTPEHADEAMLRLAARFGPHGTLHPYECGCGRWHLGRSETGHQYWWRRTDAAFRDTLRRAESRHRGMTTEAADVGQDAARRDTDEPLTREDSR